MSRVLITVLLAVHNGEPWLREAVASILAQSWREFEFLIIDDASTDGTPEFLRTLSDPRVRIVRNETNLGLTASLNRGLQLAQGDLIARQDADDLSHPHRLAKQAAFLSAHPQIAAVGSQAWLMDERGHSLGRKDFPLGHRGIWWSHLWDNALAHSAVMFRRKAVLEAGGYDEGYRASQDYELWSRLGERHLLANLPERLLTLRVVGTSITRTHRQPELIRRIQATHFGRLFPGRTATDAELDLIALFRTRVSPESLPAFRALHHDLFASYQAAWREVRISGDFARTLALQYERIGYNLLPVARAAGLCELLRALRVWPPRALALPWVRILAITLLGDSARRLYERLLARQKTS